MKNEIEEEFSFFNEKYPDSYLGDLSVKNCNLKTIKIGKIKLHDDCFTTGSDLVRHIKNLLYTNIKEGVTEEDKINPLVLWDDLTLEDGYHRYDALKAVGFKTVRAFIYKKESEEMKNEY